MLTIIYTTGRTLFPFTAHPDWNQYEVLADNLRRQVFDRWELVVVDAVNDLPRPELHDFDSRTRYLRPRPTSWNRERKFSICAARNTALCAARGPWVLSLDECWKVRDDFLELIAMWATLGHAVVPVDCKTGYEVNDDRYPWFQRMRGNRAWQSMLAAGAPGIYGRCVYPLAAALAVNGYDEHFDGGRGLEDVDFSERLKASGVQFVMDDRICVELYDHTPLDDRVVDSASPIAMCCNTIWRLARKRNHVRANTVPYTDDERRQVVHCFLRGSDLDCGYWGEGTKCCQHHLEGSELRTRELLDEAEANLIDLAAARHEQGL